VLYAGHIVGVGTQCGGQLAVDSVIGGLQTLPAFVIGEHNDQDVLCGFTEICGHLVGCRHVFGRKCLSCLAFHNLRQRREGHSQHADRCEPGGDNEPRCTRHKAAQHRKGIDACRDLGGDRLVGHD
jgi:hypothetical protein